MLVMKLFHQDYFKPTAIYASGGPRSVTGRMDGELMLPQAVENVHRVVEWKAVIANTGRGSANKWVME